MEAGWESNLTAMEEVLFACVGLVQAFLAEGFVHIVGLPGWCDLDFRAVVAECFAKGCAVGATGGIAGWDYYQYMGTEHWILVLPDGNMTQKDADATHA